MVDMDYTEQESLVTAFGFPSRPHGWTVAISRGLRSVWSGEPMILPGESLGSFIMQSKGLPAIRAARVEPYFDVSQWPDIDLLPTVDAADSVMRVMDSLRTVVLPKRLKTVGPINPPIPFDYLGCIDTLKSYVNQSRLLNWITTQTVADKYAAFLDSAREQIERGNGETAPTFLDSIMVDARRDSGTAITSEAYTLLRYNSDYLKTHLPRTRTR